MRKLESKLARFISEQEAATTVEYAIMLALIIGVCFVAIQLLGTETSNTWSSNSDEIATSMTR